jgi:outer membrane protein TolC
MDLLLLEENIRLSRFNLENNLELRRELGLVSEHDVREARRAFEQLQRQRDAAKLSLEANQEALALLLGFRADANISIEYRPEFVEGGIDLNALIRGINRDPSIIIKQREVSQAEFEFNTWTSATVQPGQRGESRDERRNALHRARRALEDAKTDMERSIRSTYNTILSLEESQRLLELALDRARDNYMTALVNLEAGIITRYEADVARMGILKAEIDLQKNVHSVDSMRFMLERPYLLVGGGA